MRTRLAIAIASGCGLLSASAELKKLEPKLQNGLKWTHDMSAEVDVKMLAVEALGEGARASHRRTETLSYDVRVMADDKVEVAVDVHQIQIDGEEVSTGFQGKKSSLKFEKTSYVPFGVDFDENLAADEMEWLTWLSERPQSWSYTSLLGDAEVRQVSEKWTIEGEDLYFEGFTDGAFAGTMTMHYLRDVEKDGVACAELETKFTGTGSLRSKRPGKSKMTIEARIFCDLKRPLVKEGHFSGSFTMEIPKAEDGNGSGTTEQTFKIVDKITYGGDVDESK